jgi:hypothetical protein
VIKPKITIARKTGAAAFLKRMVGLTKLAAYVGVPATSAEQRSRQLLDMADAKPTKRASKRKKNLIKKAVQNDINNAELLFIHTNGSPINQIPARPVLQPAIEAEDNRQAIAHELKESKRLELAGNKEGAVKRMRRAALAGQNAGRGWFTDARNGWAPNATSTIKRKGSDKPLIDTGALRASIQGIISEE